MSALLLCFFCKHLRESALVDGLGRSFCSECSPRRPEAREVMLANWVASTIPYQVGQRVSCKTGGEIYDGVGEVLEVSTDPKDLATPLVPMFRVALQDKAYPECPDEIWYSEMCLSRVDA